MKKLIFINVALVALAMFVSCQKEQFTKIVTDTKGVTEFSATIEQTKTAIDNAGKVTWVAGDEITVTDANKKSAVYLAQNAGASTKFILKEGETPVTEAPYTAAYGDITKQVYDAAGANCPLTAPATITTNFTFSSPYAVIKITAKSGTGEVIKKVEVTCDVYKSILRCGDGVILTADGNDFYIAVRPAENASLKVSFYTTDDKNATKTRSRAVTLAAKDLLPVTLTFAEDDWKEVVTLPGEFSVGATKKVQFSRGNLYWDGDSYEFEENQYTFGTWNAENHVNYFFWSKEGSVAKAASYSDASAAASDVFFTNATAETAKADFTVNGVTGEFRTLSAKEWKYILSTRANAADLLVEDVTVCDVEHCLVIAPDACLNDYVFDKTKKLYDAAAWATAEAAGLVCLPPAGYRDGTEIKSGGGNGFYWASTTDAADKASNLGFKKSDN